MNAVFLFRWAPAYYILTLPLLLGAQPCDSSMRAERQSFHPRQRRRQGETLGRGRNPSLCFVPRFRPTGGCAGWASAWAVPHPGLGREQSSKAHSHDPFGDRARMGMMGAVGTE